jgi:hypothetical protein
MARIPEQTTGRGARGVDFRVEHRFEVSFTSRQPFFQERLHAGRVLA